MIKPFQYQDDSDDFFHQVHTTNDDVNEKRVKNFHFLNQVKHKENDDEKIKIKEPIKMQKFREESRKMQRQINQSTHEFIKMAHILTNNAFEEDKFKFLTDEGRHHDKNSLKKNEKDQQKQKPIISPRYDTEIESNLTTKKVSMKDLYEILPFKKQSIEMEPSLITDPKFQFFIFEHEPESRKQLLNKLKNEIQETYIYDLKKQLKYEIKYIEFFDFIYLINKEEVQPRTTQEQKYPQSVLQIAKNTFDIDNEEFVISKNFNIPDFTTFHRVVECDQNDLVYPYETIYFPTVAEYTNFKEYREIQFKNLKVYDNDLCINTDVRNIISSQKIYLIQIGEEMLLLIKISQQVKQINLMQSIHKQMINKADEYLRLVCGYTESLLLQQYNINNVHEKIKTFIEKSIKYKKEYISPPQEVVEKFPVLQIWYKIPYKKFGCEIHQILYNLIKATIELQRKIKYKQKYNEMQTAKPKINYHLNKK